MGNPDDHGPTRPGRRPDGAAGRRLEGGADPEWAPYAAWADQAASGRVPEPEPWVLDDVTSWGQDPWDLDPWDLDPWDQEPWDQEPWDPELDAAGLSGAVPPGPPAAGPGRPLFAEDGAGDVMSPGPFLAALTEQAASEVACLTDSELAGVLRAAQRQIAREQYKQVLAAAEFGRRRHAAFEGALAQGVPAGCAAGGFPGEELAIELTVTRAEAGHLIDDALDLTSRLPRTLAAMAAGLVDAGRAALIAYYTRSLTAADAARADEVLAGAAPDLRTEQLARVRPARIRRRVGLVQREGHPARSTVHARDRQGPGEVACGPGAWPATC